MIFAVLYGNIDQLGILGLLGRSQDEGGVCGGILWLVFVDCCGGVSLWNSCFRGRHTCEVTGVTNYSLYNELAC